MKSGAIQYQDLPEGPQSSAQFGIDRDEAYSFIADPGNLASWWFRPGRSIDETGAKKVHFDSDPPMYLVDLRWGQDGDWRHMRVMVEEEGTGSRVTMTILPVPGCPSGCIEREAIRASRDLKRLQTILRSRSHLLDSDDYWM